MTRPIPHGAVALGAAALITGAVGALTTEAPGVTVWTAKGGVGVEATGASHGAVGGEGSGVAGRGGTAVAGDRGSGVAAGGAPGGGKRPGVVPVPADGSGSTGGVQGPPQAGVVRPRWQWPISPPPAVVRPFRAPLSRYGKGHRGIDLATEVGALVLAVESGRVRHAGSVAGRGTVTVQHRDGLLSTYEPLQPRVRAGDIVEAGDVLGTVHPVPRSAHCIESTCLHLGARRLGSYLDPLLLLSGGRLALLPLSRGH